MSKDDKPTKTARKRGSKKSVASISPSSSSSSLDKPAPRKRKARAEPSEDEKDSEDSGAEEISLMDESAGEQDWESDAESSRAPSRATSSGSLASIASSSSSGKGKGRRSGRVADNEAKAAKNAAKKSKKVWGESGVIRVLRASVASASLPGALPPSPLPSPRRAQTGHGLTEGTVRLPPQPSSPPCPLTRRPASGSESRDERFTGG